MNSTIITLSGSMSVYDKILEVAERLSAKGDIVLVPFKDPDESGLSDKQKKMHEELHEKRIDFSDQLYVVNHNGYIGKSTRNEILYAMRNRKDVEFLERPSVEYLGNMLLTLSHFQRLDVLRDKFNILMTDLLTSVYCHHLLDHQGKYNFITSTMDIHKYQVELDLWFEITKHSIGVDEEIFPDKLYQPLLNTIFDTLGDIINKRIDEFTDDRTLDSEMFINYENPFTMAELLYSTSSELLSKLK